MRRSFLTALCAIAIGFSAPAAAWSQSAPVSLALNATPVPHSSKAGLEATAKIKRSKIRRGLPVEEWNKDDSWFRQTPDPCQVEG
jgi:hypothetical protein